MVGLAGCASGHADKASTGANSVTDSAGTAAEAPPLYGFWGLNGFVSPSGLNDLKLRLGLTTFETATSDPHWGVTGLLPMAKSAGLHVGLRLTDDHEAYTTAAGDFDLAAWKAQVAPWGGSGVQAYIDDGTLVGHMLLDDVVNFEGRDPDAADFEEMARYSKELMPGLMTFVRQKASALPIPEGGRYVYLDANVNQYEHMEGMVEYYAANEAETARRLGLGVINGLNIADGGDGSAGRPGYRAQHHPMTAAEITAYGTVLAKVPACGMFLNWEYDDQELWSDGSIGAEYFREPELQAALLSLGKLVAKHPHVTLLKPH